MFYDLLFRHHIGANKFKETWLPTKERVEQRVATNVFKCWKGTSSFYVNEMFVLYRNIYKTRSYMALEIPLRKNNLGQKSISFMGPSILNKLSNDLKILNTVTLFMNLCYFHYRYYCDDYYCYCYNCIIIIIIY